MTDLIDGADRVTRIFGGWPSFHDAEVTRLALDRSGSKGPTLEVQVCVSGTPEDPEDHILVNLRFTSIAVLEMAQFNEQNVLFGLQITALDPARHEGRRLGVAMTSSFGLSAAFECARGEVTEVRPQDPGA